MKRKKEKTDEELINDVLSELKYEPSVKATDIGVLAKEGTVTLHGDVSNYFEKLDAVRAAQRVSGVRAVADEIQVKLPDSLFHSDGEIAAAAANLLDWSSTIPTKTIKVAVCEGWITLDGEVDWWFQKNAAENGVRFLTGVRGVSNRISIKPKPTSMAVEKDISSALERNALLDANKIQVEFSGDKVTLRGKVRNHAERDEAERVAWAAPGVLSVDDLLTVRWSWFAE